MLPVVAVVLLLQLDPSTTAASQNCIREKLVPSFHQPPSSSLLNIPRGSRSASGRHTFTVRQQTAQHGTGCRTREGEELSDTSNNSLSDMNVIERGGDGRRGGEKCEIAREEEERTRERWADASRAQHKMVFEVLQGSPPFIVSLNELFMFLCILHTT